MKKTYIRILVASVIAAAVISLLGVGWSLPFFLPVVIPLGIGKPILNKFKQAIKSHRRLNNIS
jgi:hypothetical protein